MRTYVYDTGVAVPKQPRVSRLSVKNYYSFLPRDAMQYMLSSSICLSVCQFVCLSQAGTEPKRLNVGSRRRRHTIARDS